MCEEHPKDSIHALWLCDQAQFVWKSELTYIQLYEKRLVFYSKKKKKKRFATFVSLSDIFRSVLSNGSAYFVTLSIISWRLWQSKKLFEKNKVLGSLVLWWLRQRKCQQNSLGSTSDFLRLDFLRFSPWGGDLALMDMFWTGF